MCAGTNGPAGWVGAVLDFTYDRVDAGEGSFGRLDRARQRRSPANWRCEQWAAAYFDYWDGGVDPGREWQRAHSRAVARQ